MPEGPSGEFPDDTVALAGTAHTNNATTAANSAVRVLCALLDKSPCLPSVMASLPCDAGHGG